jgi:hypothetical protein
MNHNRRWIATWVVFSFLFLIGVTSHPLAAAARPDTGTTVATSPDSGANCIEQERDEGSYHKRSSALPILIGVLAAGAVAAVLILVVFKTKYDITGSWTWTMTATSSGANTVTWSPIVFTGDKSSGTYQIQTFNDGEGSYTVDGKNVSLRSSYYSDWTWTGTFTSKTQITGTSRWNDNGDILTWNWTATKGSSSAATPNSTMTTPGSTLQSLVKK